MDTAGGAPQPSSSALNAPPLGSSVFSGKEPLRSFTSEARFIASHANGWSRNSSAVQKNRTPPRSASASSSLSPPKHMGRSTSATAGGGGGAVADDDVVVVSASSQFRLIGTTSTRAARLAATRITILGDEQRLRAEARSEEATAWLQLVGHLHTAVVLRHTAMRTTPSLVPLTNAIDGIPLLASVFVPPSVDIDPSAAQAPGAGRVATYSGRSGPRDGSASRGTVVFDGNVLVKAAAYDAVKSSTGPQPLSLHERRPMHYGQSAIRAVTASRDLTSPPRRGAGGLVASPAVADSPSSACVTGPHASAKSPASPSAAARSGGVPCTNARDADNARKMTKTLEAIRQFDAAVQKQKQQAASQFSESNNAWMPHKDIAFLFSQWRTFILKWHRRAGATPSALLASFLCTLLIDANTDADTAETINRVVMEEALEVVCDAAATTANDDGRGTMRLRYSAEGEEPDAAASLSWIEECLDYTGFCYLLRNIAMGIFPARDPVAAIHLLVVILVDHHHRAHY